MMQAHVQGELSGDFYEPLFTEMFGLDRSDYAGKRVLDVGCGPRGSLEWATMAAERVGLDPLADSYRRMGADRHEMSYVTGTIEEPALPADHFDIVASINSLDHVDDVSRAAHGLVRVLAQGGLLLVLTEVNHEPTATEPQSFSWDVVQLFSPPLEVLETRRLEKRGEAISDSARLGIQYDESDERPRPGVLVAKLRKP